MSERPTCETLAAPTEREVLIVTAAVERALLAGNQKRSLYEVVTAVLNAFVIERNTEREKSDG